jgi:hypothetical protein
MASITYAAAVAAAKSRREVVDLHFLLYPCGSPPLRVFPKIMAGPETGSVGGGLMAVVFASNGGGEEGRTPDAQETTRRDVTKVYRVVVSGLKEFHVRTESEKEALDQLVQMSDSEFFDGMDLDVEVQGILPDEDKEVSTYEPERADKTGVSLMNVSDQERRATDRRKATMAARLLASCLGIQAGPAFDVSDPLAADTPKLKAEPYGDGLYKDVFDLSARGESAALQLLVVDEMGKLKAESKESYSLGQALDLLERLPLPLSSQAQQWVKDCMGETTTKFGGVEDTQNALPAQVKEVIKVC